MPEVDSGKNYVLGRGRLYFDRANPETGLSLGEGEMYFGNTPELSLTSDSTSLDHYDSDDGVKVKDASITLEENMTGSFSCDNISAENLALLVRGTVEEITVTSATAQTFTIESVKKGRYYQIGRTGALPQGARNITVSGVTADAVAVTGDANFTVDAANGRIFIPSSSSVAEGAEVVVTYSVAASTRRVIKGGSKEIVGAIRFISNNPRGPQKNWYMPLARLTANGDFQLKGDDWQSMSWSIDVQKLNSATERLYVDAL